ncbi:MAG: glutaredoxin [Verrucomicrobiota bacterium]|jgi:glutaredoxin
MNPAPARTVTLFAMPGCLRCHRVRNFLRGNGVSFTEINVLTHPRALLKLLGRYRRVFPVVVVNEVVFRGTERAQIKIALGLKHGAAGVSGKTARSE